MKPCKPGRPAAVMFLLSLLIFLPMSAALAADPDEAWIERFMDQSAARDAESARQSRSIPFDELQAHVGDSVRVFLRGSHERRGVIEKVAGNRLSLTSRIGGGYYTYEIGRQEIVRIERGEQG